MKKIDNYIIITLFAGFLLFFSIWGLVQSDREFSPNENRVLQQLPALSASSVLTGDYTEDFQKWQDDQFPLRDRWITLRTGLRLATGGRDLNGVYIGKDGYLIEKLTPEMMNREQFEKNLSAITAFRERLPKDIQMSVMIVPTTGAIMKDKLPDKATVFDESIFVSKSKQTLKNCGWIDLYGVFADEVKKGEQLYYRTDHHWTMKGAELAFTSWNPDVKLSSDRRVLSKDFHGSLFSKVLWDSAADVVEGYGLGDSRVTADGKEIGSVYQDQFLDKKDKYAVFLGGNYGRTEIEAGKSWRRNLLIVKDSFANCFAPYAMEAYDRGCLVDLRYFSGNLDAYIEENRITDVLVLYSMKNLINDKNLVVLKNEGNILS